MKIKTRTGDAQPAAGRLPTVLRAMGSSILVAVATAASAQDSSDAALHERMDRLEAEVQRGEDVSAIKRLQRTYGYYLDKGMWTDLAELFTDDAVANYPAGVYIGKPSITRHLYLNVGAVEMGETGLGDGRFYDHMNLQPVVHLDAGGETAKGRWRAMAMFSRFGGGATLAEGIYQMGYVKEDGVWKIRTLDYHSGFGAPYSTGWVDPGERRARGPRNLPHPADRERDMPCEGFPDACLAPFHYENPGTGGGGHVWTDANAVTLTARGDAAERALELVQRASLLRDEQEIENLQRIYGYYLDRRMWDHVADLFTDDGTIEMGLRGVYAGRQRIRESLDLLGPAGLRHGELNDRMQLQIVVNVAPDGLTARSRSREFAQTGVYETHGAWSAGIYENSYVRQDGKWKIRSLRFYPTFISDYEQGWAQDAQQPPGVSAELPPDRPPSDVYEIYPAAHIPPYHYRNPVTGAEPAYPRGAGRPSPQAIAAATAPVQAARVDGPRSFGDIESTLAEAERLIARVKDYHEITNLEYAYGYYLDKNLWSDLADLFAEESSMELAQRGAYVGHDSVRALLVGVFGRGGEGPVAGRLGNHLQMQPVIHIDEDGQTARIRLRMMQQLNFGTRASMGAAVYENAAVKEDGVWKFSKVHAFNTWTAGYEGGWGRNPGRNLPGPSEDYPPDTSPTLAFEMFPNVYALPFHYDNPVSGRASRWLPPEPASSPTSTATSAAP